MKKLLMAVMFVCAISTQSLAQTVEDRVTILEGSNNSMVSRMEAVEANGVALQAALDTLQVNMTSNATAILANLTAIAIDIASLAALEVRVAALETMPPPPVFTIPVISEITDQNVPPTPNVAPANFTVVMPLTGNFAIIAPPGGFWAAGSNNPVQKQQILAFRVSDGVDIHTPSAAGRQRLINQGASTLRLPDGWWFLCPRNCNN